jgi:hypothetical protein
MRLDFKFLCFASDAEISKYFNNLTVLCDGRGKERERGRQEKGSCIPFGDKKTVEIGGFRQRFFRSRRVFHDGQKVLVKG